MKSEALYKSLSKETTAKVDRVRKELLTWTTVGAKLYGNMFGQKQREARFMNQVAFDDNNRCILFEDPPAGEAMV